MTVHKLPARQDVRLPPRRLQRREKAPCVALRHDADALYRIANDIDSLEPERAEVMYRAALLSNPRHYKSIVNLGNVLFRKGDFASARELYSRAIQVEKHSPEAHYNLGYMYFEEGDHSRAVAMFLRATSLDSSFEEAWYNLGSAWRKLGREDNARTCFDTYLRLGGKPDRESGSLSDSASSSL